MELSAQPVPQIVPLAMVHIRGDAPFVHQGTICSRILALGRTLVRMYALRGIKLIQ